MTRSLILILAATPCLGMVCRPPCPETEFHYTDALQRDRWLTPNYERLWISAPGGIGIDALSILASVGISAGELEPLGDSGAHLAPVPPHQKDLCSVRAMVSALASSASFVAVSPVFLDGDTTVVIHPFLWVTFTSDADWDEAQQILIEAGTHGLPTNQVHGRVLVSTITGDGFEVLNLADRLRGHPRVVDAQPYVLPAAPGED